MNSNPKSAIACVSNIFSRMMYFEKSGDIEDGHFHIFDHLTLLAKGSLQVTVGTGNPTIFKAPHMIFIAKDKRHELVALEDNTLAFCIHALRDGDNAGDIIDPCMIPDGVMPIIEKIAKPLSRI
jgi:quercetin dioxygenase-like cupin family protein